MNEAVKFPPHRAAVPKPPPKPIGDQVLFADPTAPPPAAEPPTPRKGPGRPKGSPNKKPRSVAPPVAPSAPTDSLVQAVAMVWGLKPAELRAAVKIVEALASLSKRHQTAVLNLMRELLV